jgi:hypothetical protein
MGNKVLFKENLQVLKTFGNNSFQPNNYRLRTNSTSNINAKRRIYEGMDVIPKFIANENMKELNNELMDRLLKKKNIFTKMMKSYFSGNEDSFTNSLQEIQKEMEGYKDIMEKCKDRDFDGFMDLLSFINSNKTNMNLSSMQSMTLNDYKNMNYDTKKNIYAGIYENRQLISHKLNLKYIDNERNKRTNNMYNNNVKENINIRNNNNNNNNRASYKKNITQEQIKLFKIFIGNPHIVDEHVISYFDISNPQVIMAADKYFKNIYGCECLTLYYYYPSKRQSGAKMHKFRFTSDIKELFMSAQDDYFSIVNPRLYLENGKEIINDKRKKCIGALNLLNNSKIKVIG